MLRRFRQMALGSLVVGLGSLAIGPALPDVIDVTVNGSVTGSGGVIAYCFPPPGSPPPGCVQPGGPGSGPYVEFASYSFSSTNTQLGTFSDSGSATANGPYVMQATAGSYADQNITATTDSLSVSLTGGYSASDFFGFNSSEQDSISVGFDLTDESSVRLSGGIFPGFASNVGELVDSNGNTILTFPNDVMNVSAILPPGMYYLDSSIGGSDSGSFGSRASGVDFNLILDASFTPVPTPEPRGALLAALLAMILGGCLRSRRRHAG